MPNNDEHSHHRAHKITCTKRNFANTQIRLQNPRSPRLSCASPGRLHWEHAGHLHEHIDDGGSGAGQHHQRCDGPGTGALCGGILPVHRHSAAETDGRSNWWESVPQGDELCEYTYNSAVFISKQICVDHVYVDLSRWKCALKRIDLKHATDAWNYPLVLVKVYKRVCRKLWKLKELPNYATLLTIHVDGTLTHLEWRTQRTIRLQHHVSALAQRQRYVTWNTVQAATRNISTLTLPLVSRTQFLVYYVPVVLPLKHLTYHHTRLFSSTGAFAGSCVGHHGRLHYRHDATVLHEQEAQSKGVWSGRPSDNSIIAYRCTAQADVWCGQ